MTTPILLKIKKLLNLARNHAATEGEADNAMRMAKEMMTKHRISMAEADSCSLENQKLREASEAQYSFTKAAIYPWEKRLTAIVAMLCDVECLLGRQGPIFIGVESESQIAVEMFAYLRETAKKLRNECSRAHPGERESIGGYRWSESYMAGLMSRLYNRIMEIKKEERTDTSSYTKVTALVVCNKKIVETYLAKRYPNIRKGRSSRSSYNSSTFAQGQSDAEKISLQRERILKGKKKEVLK